MYQKRRRWLQGGGQRHDQSMAGQWMLGIKFGVFLFVTHFLYVIAAHKDTKAGQIVMFRFTAYLFTLSSDLSMQWQKERIYFKGSSGRLLRQL